MFLSFLVLLALGPTIHPLELQNPLQDKNFYALSLLEKDPAAASVLRADGVLVEIGKRKVEAIHAATKSIGLGSIKGIDCSLWTQVEIDSVAQELSRLAKTDPRIRDFVDHKLRPSAAYWQGTQDSDEELIARSWRVSAAGMNNAISVYGIQSERGRSPDINGPIYKPTNPMFGGLVRTVLESIESDEAADDLFFNLPLRFSVGILRCQARDEAGRYEPLEAGENRKAFARAKTIAWKNYAYSAILVPGYGPEEPQLSLSPVGWIECYEAVKRWRAGKAPYIITSGGHVHPDRTPYSEAIEMKRVLMAEFKVPESAILVDPHARHTTTNIRNAARIVARDGLPFDKPILVVTNPYQATDIASPTFAARCRSVFGYMPYRDAKRLSTFEVSLHMELQSLSIDPMDPLDP